MDIDISDILASVSRPAHLQHQQPQQPPQQPILDSSTSLSDHQLLTRAWTSERSSPSILPYPTSLIDRTMTRIRTQITYIEDLTDGIPTTTTTSNITSNNNNNNNNNNNYSTTGTTTTSQNTNLILSILQTDLGRTQFLLRSYMRQRLAKIDRHAQYYLKRNHTSSSSSSLTSLPLLSPAEQGFLQNHQALLAGFYERSFLASFPPSLRRLDDRVGGVDMVEGPDSSEPVVVRCLCGRWDNEGFLDGKEDMMMRDGDDREEEEDGEKATTDLRMRRDEVWIVRWRDVRRGVLNGDLELL